MASVPDIKLIVALGNPGKEYEKTRHNVAWMALEEFPFFSRLSWSEKFKSLYTFANINGKQVHIIKPLTYMNLSGEAVQRATQFFKIELNEIVVVHDELDLDFGAVVFKQGGGLAGHNGLKSIAELMRSTEFLRLRIGIGKPVHGSVSNHVLSPFSEDGVDLAKILKYSATALEELVNKGYVVAAQNFNKKNILGV